MARSRCSRVLLTLAVTLALAALASAAAEGTQMRGPGTLVEADAAPEKAADADLDVGDAVEEAVDATLSAALSGCGLCQQTGYCDHAFRNTPGQFCLAMASGAPCCCPLGAQCAASPFDCRCRRVASYANPDSGRSTGSSSGSSFSTVLFILLVLCCVCCCWLPAHKRHREREETIHYAQPVQVDTHYGTGQQPPYVYPGYTGYPTAPVYEADNRGGGGGNSLAAGAAGAIGGLGIGAVLGSMLGGRGGGDSGPSHSSSSYFAGDTGGSSGFFGGDSGGYGGNVSQSTYTFSGDTGGDGGDDNTFGGDS